MIDPTIFWPGILGLGFLTAGLVSYRKELVASHERRIFSLAVFGPTFIAASLAAFAGEHFTIAKQMTGLVPRWMPAPLFVVYFVGVAHVCASLSLVVKRCVKWAGLGIALMFALFVLTLFLPSAIRNPHVRIVWIFPLREGTYCMGGIALFAIAIKKRLPNLARRLATLTGLWASLALVYFGTQNILFPQFTPGVPDARPTWPWVPIPHALACVVGTLLIIFGGAALARKYSANAISSAGLLMLALTLGIFLPEFFIAKTTALKLEAINFIFDTLLYGGMLFVISNAQEARA